VRAKWETRDGLEDNEPVINGNVFSYANSKIDTEGRNRIETREITSMQFGTRLQLNDSNRVELEVFSSEAEQDDRGRYNVIFRSGTINSPITFDNSNPNKPIVSYPGEFYDPANFKLKAWESESALNTDKDIGAKFDMFTQISDNTELQYGVKYRQREKSNDYNFCGYEPVASSTLADYPNLLTDRFLNSNSGPTPTFEQVKAFRNNLGSGSYALSDGTTCRNPGTFFDVSGDEEEESIAADWYTDEDILAGYAMATTIVGDATWVYGLRYEDTATTYRGKKFDGIGFAGNVSFDNDYTFLAPSLNVKFEVAEDQLVRVGLFRGLVRPGFKESRAGALVDLEDNEISGGNPDLNPTTAWNLDLTYEYYIGSESFFGAGVFFKNIKDPIVEVETTDTVFRGQSWSKASTYYNAGDSDIRGFELSYQTALDNGFVFVTNYTYTDGDTDLPADSANGQRTIPFFKQAKNSANMSIGYDKGPWDVRLAGNYRSEYLDEIGGRALDDRYTDSHFQMDLTARYEWNENLVITAEAINLNDEPEYYYFGNSRRLSQYDEYGTTYGFGVRYSF